MGEQCGSMPWQKAIEQTYSLSQTSEVTLWSHTLHAGGGLAHGKEETEFHGIREKGNSGHAFTNHQSHFLQNSAGRFKRVVRLSQKQYLHYQWFSFTSHKRSKLFMCLLTASHGYPHTYPLVLSNANAVCSLSLQLCVWNHFQTQMFYLSAN